MNALVKWDPLKDLDEFHNRLASFFDGGVAKRGRESEWLGATWAPLVDITEDDKEYVIQAELPEVEKDKVKVAVNNGVLTLTGERHLEKEEKKPEVPPGGAQLRQFCPQLHPARGCGAGESHG